MGCCDTLIKYILFIFNFLFVLVGIAIIAVGAVLLSDSGDFSDVISEIDSGLKAPQITLIVIGVIIFVIAFLGCCGAIRKNKCMLITFGVFLLIIFIIQLVIGIYAVVNFSSDTVHDVVEKLYKRTDEDSKTLFHNMETALKCCGFGGPADYQGQLPDSCFPVGDSSRGQPFQQGCGDALDDWLVSAGKVIGGVAIGLSVVEILGAVMAFFQARKSERSLF